MKLTQAQLSRRIDAAQGRILCDLILKNVRYLDVFSLSWHLGDVAVVDGIIVGLEPGLKGLRTIDGAGKSLVPGFIDAHVHIESSMCLPEGFSRAVLPKGTTTAICDPHEAANVLGAPGIEYFLRAAESLPLDLRVMLSSCVPATHLETNGAGQLLAQDLIPWRNHPRVLGLAEMMNVPGLLQKSEAVLAKLEAFSDMPIDGHAPLVKGQALSAYAACGISSCHESTELDEAREKVTKGMSVWIREGSVAKDLTRLIPILNVATSTSVGFCTDDRNPLDIATEGHIDYLVRRAIASGVPSAVAYRSASWTVARHYGLKEKGAVAPGCVADLVLLEDTEHCGIAQVFRAGISVDELETRGPVSVAFPNTVRAVIPEARELEGPVGSVHVIEVVPGKILTGRRIADSRAPGVLRLSVLERHGKGSRPANAYVSGFGHSFRGAIASSVGHDSHNLIVVGSSSEDMRIALVALRESGGGYAVVQDGKLLERLPLPFAGLMTAATPELIRDQLLALRKAARTVGCELAEPFLALAFLSLPVIPSLKLTDKGLVDVDAFKIIDVRAA